MNLRCLLKRIIVFRLEAISWKIKLLAKTLVGWYEIEILLKKELSSKANISRNTINKLSSTKRENNPKLSTLIEISKVLDVDFPQLFSRNINMKSTYDRDMNLESYLNIFIQNIEIKLRGSKQKF